VRAILLFVGVLVLMSGLLAAWYTIESTQNPFVADVIAARDTTAIIDVFNSRPQLEGRRFIGHSDAGITVVAYVHMDDSHFITTVYPQLLDRVRNGTMRYYPRYLVSAADVESRTGTYWKAKALSCFPQGLAYETLYVRLFLMETKEELLNTISSFGLSQEEITSCMNGPDPDSMLMDVAEAKHFAAGAIHPQLVLGIDGRDPTVLHGNPSSTRLDQALRKFEVRIGQ